MMATREFIKRIRAEKHKKQNGLCFYCGIRVYLTHQQVPFSITEKEFLTKHSATVDHVIALKDGGTDNPHNLVVACYPCNFHKDNNPKHLLKERQKRAEKQLSKRPTKFILTPNGYEVQHQIHDSDRERFKSTEK